MIPATIDFPCRANADYSEEFQFQENGITLDLSELEFQMQVRNYPFGPLLFSPLITMTDAANGIIQIDMSLSMLRSAFNILSQNFRETVQCVHDIVAVHGDGFKEVWAQGTLTIVPGVTYNG